MDYLFDVNPNKALACYRPPPFVAEAMTNLIQSQPVDKLTVVIMNKAPVHRKAERENQAT